MSNGAMKTTTARTSLALTIAIVLLTSLAACGTGGNQPHGPSHSPKPTPHPSTVTAQVSGIIEDLHTHVGITGLTVHWVSASGTDYEARTGADARYKLGLPPGRYSVTAGLDRFVLVTAAQPDATQVGVNVTDPGGTLDLYLKFIGPSPSPSPTSNDDSTTVSGHVYDTNGQGVPNATVEFREAACPDCAPQPWTTTDASGFYTIDLDAGVYNATCETGVLCTVKGEGLGPHPVTLPPSQTIDFVLRTP